MSWRFLRTPKWIARHLAVLLLVLAMIWAGFWQLRRLDDKRDHKALVESRQEQPALPVEDVIPADADIGSDAVDAILYRPVRAIGTYAADETVVVENRTFNGAPGAWVLTPLRLGEGVAVVVNRGFIGFTRGGSIEPPAPPPGSVEVGGLVFPSQQRGSFGATDPDSGRLDVLARVDLDRFDAQVDDDLLPAYIQLATTVPPEPGFEAADAPQLVALGPPEVDEGPHLGYAAQWFIFTTIAVGGYALLLRRVARDEARPPPAEVAAEAT